MRAGKKRRLESRANIIIGLILSVVAVPAVVIIIAVVVTAWCIEIVRHGVKILVRALSFTRRQLVKLARREVR